MESKFKRIFNYLKKVEESIKELCEIKHIFKDIHLYKQSFHEAQGLINLQKSVISLQDWNKYLSYFAISLGDDGIQYIDQEHIESLLEQDLIHQKPSSPFIQEPRSPSKKYSLILDLDETLIHFPDHKVENFEEEFPESLQIRPYALQFIKNVSKYFELIVFTAATKMYADKILDYIDPEKFITYRLYDEHLTYHKKKKVKNLELIGRDLSTVIIIEDIPENYALQQDNGFHIRPWYGDPEDKVFCLLNTIFMAMGQVEP